MTIPISFACGDYDRVRALRDGTVRAEGVELTFVPLGPEEIFFRQMVHQEFDVSEMSLGTYVSAIAAGVTGFVAIPAFPSRSFRHSAIFVNTEAGIARPEDLRGKRVGVAEYQLTANVWARGILEDEYGVKPNELMWRTGGLEETGRREKHALQLPGDLMIEPIPDGATLSAMLERGDIDALITPRMPSAFRRGAATVRRLFAEHRGVETDYCRRTGIFPIMHTVVIRRELYERDRWLAQSFMKALTEAKRLALDTMYQDQTLAFMVPWMNEEVETLRGILGTDWWAYGLEPNRKVLETFLRYAVSQGVARRPLNVEELFAPETLDTVRI